MVTVKFPGVSDGIGYCFPLFITVFLPPLVLLEGDSGRRESASATRLLLPVRYMMSKSYKASSLSQRIYAAPSLLVLTYTNGLLSV